MIVNLSHGTQQRGSRERRGAAGNLSAYSVLSHRQGAAHDIQTLTETITSNRVFMRTHWYTRRMQVFARQLLISLELQLIPRRISHISPLWLFSCINLEQRLYSSQEQRQIQQKLGLRVFFVVVVLVMRMLVGVGGCRQEFI